MTADDFRQPYHRSSLSLLPHIPPTFTLSVHYRPTPFPLPSVRRTIQLRGTILLLSQQQISNPRLARILPLTALPTCLGRRSVSLSTGQVLRFNNTPHRDLFLRSLETAFNATNASQAYAPVRRLGAGASASVYLVRSKQTNQHFALKAIPKPLIRSHARISHLITERVALAEAADHNAACIVKLVDAFETNRHFCFVTQLAAYGDLRNLIKQLPNGRLDHYLAKHMFAEMVLALEECHRMGFLFRDLKLANLLLDATGHVRLADFGLVKRMRVEHEHSDLSTSDVSAEDADPEDESFRLVGRTATFVGTRRYMSPEHVKTSRPYREGYGAPADIWALGVCLYLLLTGNYPFARDIPSNSVSELYHAIQCEQIRYPKWLGEEVIDLMRGMLHRRVSKRLELHDIKTHPWLGGISWTNLRMEARANVPQKQILEYLKEHDVEPIEESTWDQGFDAGSSISSTVEKKGMKGKVEDGTSDLLGFGYVPCTELV